MYATLFGKLWTDKPKSVACLTEQRTNSCDKSVNNKLSDCFLNNYNQPHPTAVSAFGLHPAAGDAKKY